LWRGYLRFILAIQIEASDLRWSAEQIGNISESVPGTTCSITASPEAIISAAFLIPADRAADEELFLAAHRRAKANKARCRARDGRVLFDR
jgi:hypothetical protein